MSPDARKTATIGILTKCLERHLGSQREQVLKRIEAKGWDWQHTQDESSKLEQVDEALTQLRCLNAEGVHEPQP